jgi:hypothetical protein
MFEPGHKYGNHNNHYKGGRLTKEQLAELAGLVPKSIEVWRKILEMPVSAKGMSVQADVAGKVLNKFVADLSEIKDEHGIDDGFAKLLSDIAAGVSGKSLPVANGTADNSKENGV